MQDRRTDILFFSLAAMLVFLFLSRVLLSAGMIFFTVVSFCHRAVPAQLKRFLQTPLLWGMSLLFFVPLLSGLWSGDKALWLDNLQVKLPLLFLPLAFAGLPVFSRRQWEALAGIYILSATAGTCYSFYHYLSDPQSVNAGYLRARSLLTPLANDHVRFSWMLSMAVLFCGWLAWQHRKEHRGIVSVCAVIALFLIFYLHVLAARTGLVSLYLILLFVSVRFILQLRVRYSLFLLVLLVALPVIAYRVLPTFQNRVRYFKYELAYLKEAHYLPGANDAVRLLSWKAGWSVLAENPVRGVGFGDIRSATLDWYGKNVPGMLEADKIYPSGEWLLYGAGAGLPGLLVFFLATGLPFFTPVKHRLSWFLVQLTALVGFAADIGLEVQFGVFLYSFTVLCCWKWWSAEKN